LELREQGGIHGQGTGDKNHGFGLFRYLSSV